MEKSLAQISTEIVLLDQNLNALRKNYLKRRDLLTEPLKKSYNKSRSQIIRKQKELTSLLRENIVDAIMQPATQKPVDTEISGYSISEKGINGTK